MADLISMLAASGAAEGEATDADFENTVLLLHGDGTNGAQNNTFLDSSTNNFTITRNGNTTQGTFSPFSKPDGRWGNYFDGSGDFLTWPSGASVNFGTGDFTVEAFLYVPANPVADYIIDARDASNTGGWAFAFGLSGSGYKLGFYFNNSIILEEATESIASNTWQHCVVVRSGTTISIFIQGTRVATTTNSSNINLSPGTGYIGNRYTSSGFEFSGYMTNVRIVKSAVYDPSSTTITVPTAPLTAITNTSLLTCQSNRFKDNSSNAFAITRNGDVKVTPFSPFPLTTAYDPAVNGGAGYFDGSGDYLSVPTNSAFAFGTGDFTIEMWVNTRITTQQQLYEGRQGNATNTFVFFINTSTQLAMYGNGSTILTSSSAVPLNAWTHCVLVRSGTTLSIFQNGTRVATTTNSTNWSGTPTNSIYIGVNENANDVYMNGFISGVRVVKGTAVYDPTSTTYTVPTAPLTAISGTSLLLNYTNAGILDNTGFNALETVGNAQIDTSVKKYGTGSMKFDGNGDYLLGLMNPDMVFGTGDMTIECWVNPNTISGTDTIFDTRTSGAYGTNSFTLQLESGVVKAYAGSASGELILAGTTAVSTGTWTHIAFTRASGTNRIFVGGSQQSSNTTSWNQTFTSTNTFYIGQTIGIDRPFDGYIDDLRITKGIARYTAAFTPPTAAFPDIGD